MEDKFEDKIKKQLEEAEREFYINNTKAILEANKKFRERMKKERANKTTDSKE